MPTGGVSPEEANLRGWFEAGLQSIRWSGDTEFGTRAPAGLYFVLLRVEGSEPEVESVVLLR